MADISYLLFKSKGQLLSHKVNLANCQTVCIYCKIG